MTTKTISTHPPFTRSIVLGIIGGLIGGVVFGIMMAMQNMLPMVGMLIGQESPIVGFIIHMVISAFIGGSFGLLSIRLPSSWPAFLIGGGVYGVIWWVLGALILMPVMLGMNEMVLQIGDMQIMSLVGHIIFGVVMGGAFKAAAERMS